MKKNLLLGCALLAAGTSFAAIPNDGCTYEAKDGIEMKSVWCASRLINPEAWTKVFQETGLDGDYNRRCCVFNDKIYVTHGEKIVEGEGESATESYPWWLVSFDLMTGELIDKKPLMFENQQFQGLLTAMNIGTDDFGHIWVSGFNGGAEGTLIPIYVLDPETATLTRAGEPIEWPVDDAASRARIDFCDIAGDVTGEQAEGVYGAAGAATTYCYRFVREQDSPTWEPGMDGYAAWPGEDVKLWPDNVAAWGDNSTLIFADGTTTMFYANGRNTLPTCYSCEGGVSELKGSFEMAGEGCSPDKPGTTGAFEFVLGDHMYLAYGNAQGDKGSTSKISRMGGDATGGTFEGMELMWNMPAGEAIYSDISNGGQALRGMYPVYKEDANGKKGVYILSFYPKTVMALYLVAEPGFSAGVNDIVADNDVNAPVEYFNLQGVKVSNPENGLYIVRQGNTVTKRYVVK